MIQRKQTLWLLLAALCAFATYMVPIFTGKLVTGQEKSLLSSGDFLLFPLFFGTGALAAVDIFLFKNRKLQFNLAILGVVLSIICVVAEYFKTEAFRRAQGFASGSYQFGMLFPFLMIVFFILAARGIYKDEKLVKSLNRLR